MSETTIIPKGTCSQCGREDFVGEATDFLCSRCADDRDYDDAQSYRRVARILGIDPADREAVERRVTELHDKTRSLGELFGFTFTCPRCGGHHFGSTLDPQTHEPILRHCHDEFGRGCRWSGSDAECGLAPKGD